MERGGEIEDRMADPGDQSPTLQERMSMEDPSRMSNEDPGFQNYQIYIALSVVAFSLVNFLTRYALPACASNTFRQSWKWRNVATSLVHSFVTGIWAPVAFYYAPEMWDDIKNTFSQSTYLLVSFSIGYFIYDSLDMLLYHRKRSTYELMIHHSLVIICFSIAVRTGQYVAYGGVSLIVEINSVFLHMRQLFIITEEPKSSFRYKVNSVLNVGTFLVFRIYLFGWMTRWLTIHKEEIPFSLFALATVALTVIIVMNLVLLVRILSVDLPSFVGKTSKQSKELNHDSSNGKSLGKNGHVHKNGTRGKVLMKEG